jgi:chemotaxis response regulator CheB
MERVLILPHSRELDDIVVRLVNLLGYHTVVALPADSPTSAIERAQPSVVMLDADHPEAGDAALLLAAQRANAAVVLFSASLTRDELRREADAGGVGHFLMPNGPRVLAIAIADARTTAGVRRADDPPMRIARWARLAAHHQGRVTWHQDVPDRVGLQIEAAVLSRNEARAPDATRRAVDAARQAREQLRAEVTRYVQDLKTLAVSKADTMSRVGGVVHGALHTSSPRREASALEAQVEQWCIEAYESAA